MLKWKYLTHFILSDTLLQEINSLNIFQGQKGVPQISSWYEENNQVKIKYRWFGICRPIYSKWCQLNSFQPICQFYFWFSLLFVIESRRSFLLFSFGTEQKQFLKPKQRFSYCFWYGTQGLCNWRKKTCKITNLGNDI